MKTIILTREDFSNELHPFMFDQLLEELDLPLEADMITLYVARAESDVAE